MICISCKQVRRCYLKRFGDMSNYNMLPHFDVPWLDFLVQGNAPHPKGGCNDLITSGHAAAMAVFPTLATYDKTARLTAGRMVRGDNISLRFFFFFRSDPIRGPILL